MSRFEQFFSDNFLMPHGACFMWLPEIVWLHVFADALIAISYFTIPVALWVFAKKRPDMPFRPLLLAFAVFILLCGLTHIFGIIVLWHPIYGIEGLLMLATGLVSAATAIVVWRILPMAIKLPSPMQYKKMNDDLNEAYTNVEEKVEERTVQLRETLRALEEEKEKLARANAAKEDFIANVSHEIRTPLNVILVLAEKLFHKNMPKNKHEESLEKLFTSSQMLSQLISDVLDFSKIEAGAMELAKEPFDLKTIISEVAALSEVQASHKKITFDTKGNFAKLPTLNGDSLRLKQILINLTSNAIKFTEKGSVTLKAEGKVKDDAVDITLSVIDTGKGISPENQKKIFEKFTQEDTKISQQFGGTGLGLAISRLLAEKMEGTLSLESAVDEGSTFTIALSLPIADEEHQTLKVAHAKPAKKKPSSTSRKKTPTDILLVEDTPGNILVAELVLGELGYEHTVAKNGEEAEAIFREHQFKVVLMDLRLPDMSGYDITARFREIEEERGSSPTPIVAMTAFASPEEKQKCAEAGMDGFTTKPVDVEELGEILSKWLD